MLASVLLAVSACKGREDAAFTDRVWVDTMPRDGKSSFSSLFFSGREGRWVGVWHRGSLYRGRWDLLRWRPGRGDQGSLEFLQDGQVHGIELKSCKPMKGFDLCVELVGDPTGVGRWYSKTRWKLPRRKTADAEPEADFAFALEASELQAEHNALIARELLADEED